MWSVRPSAARRRDARCFGGAPLATLNQSPATLTALPSHRTPRDRHPTTTTRTSPRTPTAYKCARARLRPRFPCVLTAARLPTTRLSVVLLTIAAASVPVRSECSVLLVARPWHTRVIRRRRSVINSFRVLSALTCVPITPTVSYCVIDIDRLDFVVDDHPWPHQKS